MVKGRATYDVLQHLDGLRIDHLAERLGFSRDGFIAALPGEDVILLALLTRAAMGGHAELATSLVGRSAVHARS